MSEGKKSNIIVQVDHNVNFKVLIPEGNDTIVVPLITEDLIDAKGRRQGWWSIKNDDEVIGYAFYKNDSLIKKTWLHIHNKNRK